jgi:hypothetical protein
MNDQDLEQLIGRYRPITRLPDLSMTRLPRTWPWAVAAAALLAISIGLHSVTIVGGEGPAAIDVQPLAQQLGGDALAYSVARLSLAPQPRRADNDVAMGVPAWMQ